MRSTPEQALAAPAAPAGGEVAFTRLAVAASAEERAVALAIAAALQAEQTARFAAAETPKAFHAKTHAVLDAEFEVLPVLPPLFMRGIFATPQTIPCRLRYSASPGGISSDLKPEVAGLGIQLQTETGEPLGLGFTLQTMKTFPIGTPRTADTLFYWLAMTRFFLLNGLLLALALLLTGRWRELRALWRARGVQDMHRSLNFSSFYSTTPYAFGGDAAKYSLRPMKFQLPRHTEPGDVDRLTSELEAYYRTEECRFEFGVQLQRDEAKMPVEDCSVEWSENGDAGGSCFFPVAMVRVKRQTVRTTAKTDWAEMAAFGVDAARFPEHAPLGGINRVRDVLYAEMARFHRERRAEV